jgi:iron(III) transport system permease protein
MMTTISGTGLAWMLHRTNMPAREILSALIMIPFFIPEIVMAFAWMGLGSPEVGLLNLLGRWLLNTTTAVIDIFGPYGIILVAWFCETPILYVFVSTGFLNMDPSLEEAARVAGAGTLKTMMRITFPLVLPSIVSGMILQAIRSLEMFSIPAVLGMPSRFYVLSTQIYSYLARYPPYYGTAAALSVAMLVMTSMFIIFQRWVMARGRYVTVTGRGYRPSLIDIGKFRSLALGFVFLYFLVSTALPIFALVLMAFEKFVTFDPSDMQFTLNNFRWLATYPVTLRALENSLFLGLVGAALAILLTTMISLILVRTKAPGRGLLSFLCFMPVSVPSIVLAVGLLLAWLPVRFPPIYGTIWLLLVAYVTRHLPYGTSAVSSSLLSVHEELEEAGRVSGASWLRTLATVTMPLIKSGLLGGWMLMFIFFFRELSASVLLYATGSEVVSVVIFDLWNEGRIVELSAFSVIMMVIIFVVVVIAQKAGLKFKVV